MAGASGLPSRGRRPDRLHSGRPTGRPVAARFRTVLGKPMPAAAFLFAYGLILFLGERLRRRAAPVTAAAPAVGVGARGEGESLMRGVDLDEGVDDEQADLRSDARIAGLSLKRGVLIGRRRSWPAASPRSLPPICPSGFWKNTSAPDAHPVGH